MKIGDAYDNLAKFFEDADDESAQIPAEAFRDESGKIIEIRVFNAEYEEIIVITRRGEVEAISVDEYEESVKF